MLKRTLRPSRLAIIALLVAGPASAQYYYGPGYGAPDYGPPPGYGYNAPPPPGMRGYGRPFEDDYAPRAPRPISARAVVDRLEASGYEDVGAPRFTGTLYIVNATVPGGERHQVTVDAIRGIVLNRILIAPADGTDNRMRVYRPRPLDTRDLDEDDEARSDRRREASRSGPIVTTPSSPAPGSRPLARPADPRLDPDSETVRAPRPAEDRPKATRERTQSREARAEPKPAKVPDRPNPRPFGLDPAETPAAVEPPKAEVRQTPSAPAKAKPVAEARPNPGRKVRVIGGVTPVITGESRNQLDNLPKPPETAAPKID